MVVASMVIACSCVVGSRLTGRNRLDHCCGDEQPSDQTPAH